MVPLRGQSKIQIACMERSDGRRDITRVMGATVTVYLLLAAGLCASPSKIQAGIFDRVRVPDGSLPIASLERLADPLPVNLAVAPEGTRTLIVLAALVPVRASGGVPAPEI